jgi:hypothetical protein
LTWRTLLHRPHSCSQFGCNAELDNLVSQLWLRYLETRRQQMTFLQSIRRRRNPLSRPTLKTRKRRRKSKRDSESEDDNVGGNDDDDGYEYVHNTNRAVHAAPLYFALMLRVSAQTRTVEMRHKSLEFANRPRFVLVLAMCWLGAVMLRHALLPVECCACACVCVCDVCSCVRRVPCLAGLRVVAYPLRAVRRDFAQRCWSAHC